MPILRDSSAIPIRTAPVREYRGITRVPSDEFEPVVGSPKKSAAVDGEPVPGDLRSVPEIDGNRRRHPSQSCPR
jgi:hypothetical protein